ncbi:unnamed protein product [Lupinus luteus]|uniref:DUF8018 domain-containing protein n=1 Tax=Lupinus luteus TaxID=3873 RepID=A0AAV1Y3W1_LUPLU
MTIHLLYFYGLAGIRAEDHFRIKVDIIRRMATLDSESEPEGDWLGRGARALDNPRTKKTRGRSRWTNSIDCKHEFSQKKSQPEEHKSTIIASLLMSNK